MPAFYVTGSGSVTLDRVISRIRSAPLKRVVQGFRLLANYRSHMNLAAAIRETGLRTLSAKFPEYRFKYLGNYLSPMFTPAQRAGILAYHYQAVSAQRVLPFRSLMAGAKVEFWSRQCDGDRFSVSLAPPGDAYQEGDLVLVFQANGKPLYRLSFSLVPAEIAGFGRGSAILIGGSQGYRGTGAESRRVAKILGEICPATLLLIQLRALAKALEIQSVLAISLADHSCADIATGVIQPRSAYDLFWEANGGVRVGRYYRLPSDLVWGPVGGGSSSHRARSRRKRERKTDIYLEFLATCRRRSSLERMQPVDSTVRNASLTTEMVVA